MDDELEAELLAVTDTKSTKVEKDYSDPSDSDQRDSDAPDSDRDDYSDDGRRSDDNNYDMHDEEDESEDDEDDDDYSVGGKKKSSRKLGNKKGQAKRKKAASKKKAPTSPRKRPKLNLDDIGDDEEDGEEFKHEYDENGYGDAEDRERLMRMTEVERETILDERVNERRRKYKLWQVRREMLMQKRQRGSRDELAGARRSGRSKVNAKSAAINNMLDKDKKTTKAGDLSDVDSEPDRDRKRTRSPSTGDADKYSKQDTQDLEDMRPDKGPDLRYSDLVRDDGSSISTTLLFARRNVLSKLSQRPGFPRAVKGMFVRVRVSGPGNAYLLCRVADVEKGKAYKIHDDVRTDYHLVLQSGMQKRTFSIAWCSGSHPNPHEFETYKNRLLQAGGVLPDRDEIIELLKKSEAFIIKEKAEVTEEERRAHRAHNERMYPEQVNWTVKRTEVQMALDVKQQDYEVALRRGNKEEAEALLADVERYTNDLRGVQAMERKYVRKEASSNAVIFQELAKKNRAENMRMDRLASTQRRRSAAGGTGAVNPYSRVETTGQSYYNVPGKNANGGIKPEARPVAPSKHDWRSLLKTWKPGEMKRTISDNPVEKHYGTPVAGLDDLVWPPPASKKPDPPKSYGPCVDAVYAHRVQKRQKVPEGAKIISFEDWLAAARSASNL